MMVRSARGLAVGLSRRGRGLTAAVHGLREGAKGSIGLLRRRVPADSVELAQQGLGLRSLSGG